MAAIIHCASRCTAEEKLFFHKSDIWPEGIEASLCGLSADRQSLQVLPNPIEPRHNSSIHVGLFGLAAIMAVL